MMWIPVLSFGLLAGGAILLLALPGRFSHYRWPAAVALPLLCLLLWLPLRAHIPLGITFTPGVVGGLLPHLAWRIDALTWPVTAWLLLVLAGAHLANNKGQMTNDKGQGTSLLLTAVTLAALWSDSLAALMGGWAALLVVWAVAHWRGGSLQAEDTRFLRKIGLLLAAVLLPWLGAAAPPPGPGGFTVGDRPQLALWAALAAVLLQMGIWPLAGWRPALEQMSPAGAMSVVLLPVVAGGVLLVRLAEAELAALTGALLTLLTLLALFGLLHSAHKTWEQLSIPATAVLYLVAAPAHLLLLTAVWGHTNGALAMLRVYILAGAILLLVTGQPVTRARWWRAIAPGVALASLAGLPLTAGLAGQVALYTGLQLNGRFILLLVTVLLQILLIAAALRLFWPAAPVGEPPPATGEAPPTAAALTPVDWLREGALFVPVLGLLSLSGVSWTQVSWLVWLCILAAAAGGVLLFRFVPTFHHTVAAVRRAFTFNLPVGRAMPLFHEWRKGMGGAVEEAAAILEGDGSLLWLLVVIVAAILLSG